MLRPRAPPILRPLPTTTCSWKLKQPALHLHLSGPQSHPQSRSERRRHRGNVDACPFASIAATDHESSAVRQQANGSSRVPFSTRHPECPSRPRRETLASRSKVHTAQLQTQRCRCACPPLCPWLALVTCKPLYRESLPALLRPC